MSMSPTRRTARAAAAAVATVALGASGLVVLAPQAQAAAEAVTTAQATWGFKQSFRSYMASAGSVTVTQGAAFTGATNSAYSWPVAAEGGSYDPVTRAGTIHFAGKVTYAYPAHEMRDISLSNPTVVLAGNGTGVLKADVSRDVGGDTMPLDVGSATQVTVAAIAAVPAPTVTTTAGGQTATFSNIATTLTQSGVDGLGLEAFYDAGDPIDPLSFSVEHAPIAATASTTSVTLSPSAVQYGRASVAKVTVTGATSAAGSTVTVKEGSRTFGSAKLNSAGVAYVKLPTNLTIRRHPITASFPGSVSLLPSSKSASLLVAKATTKAWASLPKKSVKASKRAYFNAKVTATGFVPSGIVRVKEGSKVLASARLVRGKATIKLPKLKRGKHRLAVVYLGNTVAKASASGKVTLTVKK